MPIVVIGEGRVISLFRGMRRRANNPEAAWEEVGEMLSDAVENQFRSDGAWFGTPWAPLTPAYLARKLSRGYPRDILIASGEMKRTFTGRPMEVETYRGKTATYGSNNQKAKWHHGGTRRNGRQVNPPRPILKATSREARAAARILAKHIMRGV